MTGHGTGGEGSAWSPRGSLSIPRNLLEVENEPGCRAFIQGLPALVREVEARWSLDVGEPYQPGGRTAWVAPAHGHSGEQLVLKLARPHVESLHEADGLRIWDGDGTVKLIASDAGPEALVLLLERCLPGSTLATRPEPEQDVVVARLLNRLWRRPPDEHPFRPLQLMCEEWAAEAEVKMARGPIGIDRGLMRAGLALFRELPADAGDTMLLSTDLHAENILTAEREPWLVIDPKPHVGDPTYDALQHMLNCGARLSSTPRALVARMAGLSGLDSERLLLWLFARCVQEVPDRPWLAQVARRIAPV